jgi:hypothetical protein
MGKTDNNMNEKQKQLYSYIKDQGVTDLSIDDFYAAYGNNPDKAKNVFSFVNSNEMTDLNESDFFNAYFGEVKKKVTSEPVGDTKDTTASTTEQAPLGPISSDSQQSDPISERGIGFEMPQSDSDYDAVMQSMLQKKQGKEKQEDIKSLEDLSVKEDPSSEIKEQFETLRKQEQAKKVTASQREAIDLASDSGYNLTDEEQREYKKLYNKLYNPQSNEVSDDIILPQEAFKGVSAASLADIRKLAKENVIDYAYIEKAKENDESLIEKNVYDNRQQIRDVRYKNISKNLLNTSDKQEYDLLTKLKKVEKQIEDYNNPKYNKFIPNLEEALKSSIKDKKEIEISIAKNREAYLEKNEIEIEKARLQLEDDPDNESLKENLLKAKGKYNSFINPIDAAKKIYTENPDIAKAKGDTPMEKFLNYFDGAVLQYNDAKKEMTNKNVVLSAIPLIDEISGASEDIRKYAKAYKKIKELAPIALLNRKALSEDNFFSQLGKSFASGLTDGTLFTTEAEQSEIIFDALGKSKVLGNVSEEQIDALESSFNMNIPEKIASTLGSTLSIMPAFMSGGAAIRGLKNVTKIGKAFDKVKDMNRVSKLLLGATESGIAYEASALFGDEAVGDEASFLAGALGEVFSQGLSTVAKRNIVMSAMVKAFGNNASKAQKYMAIVAQRSGQGFGEVAEEYGNEMGAIIDESNGSLKEMKSLFKERFGTLDQNLEFGLMTFGMGIIFGSATKAGQGFADSHKEWLSNQSDEVKAQFNGLRGEVNEDINNIVNEVSKESTPVDEEVVSEEATPVAEEAVVSQEERKGKIKPTEIGLYENVEKSINDGLEISERLSKNDNVDIADNNKEDIKNIKDNREDISSEDIINEITSNEFIDEYGDWQKAKDEYDILPTNERTKENRLKILLKNNITVMTDKNMMPKVMFHGTKANRYQLKNGIRGGSFVTDNIDYASGHGRVLKGFVKVENITEEHSDDSNVKFNDESNYIEYSNGGAGIVKDNNQFKEIKKSLATPVAEETAPVASVVEEVISEVTEEESSLQSEIEDFDSQIEDLDGEIGSVKSETKEGIAKIDSEIKKVRASKIDKESKAERIEELKYEKIDLKEDQRTQIDSYKDDVSILKKDRKKSERKLNKIIENKTAPVSEAAPVAQETTTEEITIFRGVEPRKDSKGKPKTVHKIKKGKFGSAKIEGTDGNKGTKPIKKFTLPAGTTVETVKLPGNTPAATSRVELETEAIDNSTAQVVKLETIDAGGRETQYIIKDDSILESGVDMTTEEETSARESAPESTKDEIDRFIEEQAESLEKELTQRTPNFQLSQDESSEVRKEKLKEEALEPVISNYKQFVTRLTKAFPGVEVMEDQKSFDELVNSIYAKKLSTKNQKIYGAVYNGKLYLNPAFKNFNTPIHEFGHIWINTVKTLKPELYSKGLDLVQRTEYETSVRNNKDYKRVVDKMRKDGATQEQINTYILEEALAIAIGDKGESFVNASVSRDFKNWLEDLYNNIKKMMGISKYTSEQLENITLDEFVQAVSVDLLSGEKLFDSQVEGLLDALQLMTAPNGDSIYDIIQYGRSKEYPDSVIRKTLIDKKFKVKDIDAALEINLDIFTKVPFEFQRVADGAKSAVELFEGVKKQLDKFINENKKASITKVREQGIKILKSNPIFKEQNAQVKMELIDGFNRSINLKKGNLTFQKKMANLRNSIKDRVKGSKDLAKVHASMKRIVLSNLLDLKFSKYKRSNLNKILRSIGSLDMDNIKKKSEKILEVIDKQRTEEKSGAIKAIKKIVKDNSRKKAKIDKDSKSFFKSAVGILKTLTSGNETKIETLSMYINANQPLNDGIQDKIAKGESLTPKEIEMYNDFLAYEMFNNIDNMTLEEVMDVYNGLNSNKKEAIQILKDIKSIEAKKRVSEAVEATEQIKKTNPELFDENGTLLDSNQIKAKRQEIYEKFKALKIPEAISDFVNLFKFGGYTFMIRNLKNELINNVETLTNIADRTTKGLNLFREKIYDRLNVMNTERIRGLDETLTKINSIADNIGIKYKSKTGRTFTGYKAVQTTVHTKGSMKIKGIVGSSGAKSIGRFGASELMTIYAYWRNADVKKKLIEQGFTDEKIKDIEKHLGKDLIAFVDGVSDFLSTEYHQGVNEVYSEVNYNNLRAIENYFPLAVLGDEKDSKMYSQLINDSNFSEAFNTETAPYFKARNDKETDVDLTDIDFFTKLDRYINTMEEYKAYAKGAKNLHSFFEIPAVKTLLKGIYIDKPIRSFVLKQLAPNSMGVDGYKGYAVFRGLMSNLTRVVLGFKAVQILKQALSFVQSFSKYDYFGKDYKGDIPLVIRRRADGIFWLMDAARMYATLAKDLVGKDGVISEAREVSPDFKERSTQALKGDVYSLESGTGIRNQRKKFTRASRGAANLAAVQGAGTTIGDVLGVLGYMINYKRNIANGMNKSDAARILNDYNSTQQTRRDTERTKLQGEKNPLIRTFLMFGSAIFAQQNKIAQSSRNIIRSIFSAQIPKTEDVRSFVINGFLVNILFEMVSSIFRLMDGDDEDLEEVMNSIKETMLFTKQGYALPLIGSALEEMDAGGRAIAKLDFKFYEKPKYRSEDVVNPFMIMYRRTMKNADSDRGLLYNSARPLVEGLAGFNADPFIGAYNYFSADDLDFFEQEQEFLNMIGVTPSYQPNRLKDDVREQKFVDQSKASDEGNKTFLNSQGDVKAATGKEGREGTKRDGPNTRDDYR